MGQRLLRLKSLPSQSSLRREIPSLYSVVPLVLVSSFLAAQSEQVVARGWFLRLTVLLERSKNLRRPGPSGPDLRELTISSVGFSYSEVDCQSFSSAARESFLSQDSSSGSRRQHMCQSELGACILDAVR